MNVRAIGISFVLAALSAMPAAQAQWWRHHPGYLHAMSDLRTAYWLVEHEDSDDRGLYRAERDAMGDIRAAYLELKDASIVDDKDIDDQPPPDMDYYDHSGRLHHAMDLLMHARHDISGEERDRAARGLRNRALVHIDEGVGALNNAITYWRY
jgi:hypothetical protein